MYLHLNCTVTIETLGPHTHTHREFIRCGYNGAPLWAMMIRELTYLRSGGLSRLRELSQLPAQSLWTVNKILHVFTHVLLAKLTRWVRTCVQWRIPANRFWHSDCLHTLSAVACLLSYWLTISTGRTIQWTGRRVIDFILVWPPLVDTDTACRLQT